MNSLRRIKNDAIRAHTRIVAGRVTGKRHGGDIRNEDRIPNRPLAAPESSE